KCGRIDHIKVNYPFTKKEKDKAFLAAWSASEDESEDSDGECISAYMEIATEEEHCDINNTNPELESVDLDTNNHKHSSQQQEQEPHTNIVESVSSTNKVSEGPDIPQAPPHIIPRHPPTQVI
ncbi:hypothetical protein LINGRAHAP2_LOCUS4018, partial [Linum grandiflorum]